MNSDQNYYGKLTDVIIRPKALGARNGLYCKACKYWWFDGMSISLLGYPPCPQCGAKNPPEDIIWSESDESTRS